MSVVWFVLLMILVSKTSCTMHEFSKEDDLEIVSFGISGPSPMYVTGRGAFGKGSIDLGGLQVSEALYFKKTWDTQSGVSEGLGATFYEPTAIPAGFNLLGHYSRPNTNPFSTSVLVAKDTTDDLSHGALRSPIDYSFIWTSEGLNISRQNEDGYIWLSITPIGYKAVGHVVTTTPEKPSLDKGRCVRSDLTDSIEVDTLIWGVKVSNTTTSGSIDVCTVKPMITQELSISVGTFLARVLGSELHDQLACLKIAKTYQYLAMSDSLQINNLYKGEHHSSVNEHPVRQYR